MYRVSEEIMFISNVPDTKLKFSIYWKHFNSNKSNFIDQMHMISVGALVSTK